MATTVDSVPRVDFLEVVQRLHRMGREVVGPNAASVDSEARFPHESFEALREAQLLGAYVTAEFGGAGLTMTQICHICEVLGQYCASTAMVYAMHQIQVACILHHGTSSQYFRDYLSTIADEQVLLASATTELGVGGDLRSSQCHIERADGGFSLEKQAPVISYGLEADAILVTARRSSDAAANDQAMVLVERGKTELEQIAGWDTLGFRGTRSLGFSLRATGGTEQILPAPFADILTCTMHPYAHLTWGSLWVGIATDAVNRARDAVRKKILDSPGSPPLSALRLAEVDEILFGMRAGLHQTMAEYQQMLDAGDWNAMANFGFGTRVNNVKITCSEKVVDVVGRALQIVGISGYKNDSSSSLSRQLRDAYGAALMVNNDRIRGHNSTLQVVNRKP